MMENPHNQEIYLIKFRGQDDGCGSPKTNQQQVTIFFIFIKN